MGLVRAKWSAHIRGGLFLEEGSLWDDSDPVVKAHPDWFSDDFSKIVHRSVADVEQATAAPGEKRTTKRP